MDEYSPFFLRVARFLLQRPLLFRSLRPYEFWLHHKYPNPSLPQFSYQVTIHSIRTLYGRAGKIGWASLFFPCEFLHAASLVPFYPEIAAGLVTALGFPLLPLKAAEKAWFSQDLCSYHRLSVGMSLLGFFPRPDFLFATSSICQGTVPFFETLRELFRVPLFVVDVPKAFTRETVEYVAEQLKDISQDLEKNHHVLFSWDRPFSLSNRTREIFWEIECLRKRKDHMLCPPTKNLDYLPYYYEFLGREESLYFAEKLLEEVRNAQRLLPHRLVWLHLKPFYRSNLVPLLEELGLGVAFEEFASLFPEELSPREPFLSLSRKILWSSETLSDGKGRLKNILRILREYEAQGAIQFNQWGCRQSQGMNALLRETLKKEGYPVLFLDGDHLDKRHNSQEQIRTRLEAFREML